MRALARVELGLIAAALAGVAVVAPALPSQVSVGGLALVVACTLLGQGLVRDLWLLRHPPSSVSLADTPGRPIVCVESGLGIVIIIVGLALLGLGVSASIELARASWTAVIGGALVGGFVIKDWVLEARPLRLRREPDHGNVILGWGRSAPRCQRRP